jgi:hypothetical protein
MTQNARRRRTRSDTYILGILGHEASNYRYVQFGTKDGRYNVNPYAAG